MAGNNHMTKEGTSEMLCMETLPWNDVQRPARVPNMGGFDLKECATVMRRKECKDRGILHDSIYSSYRRYVIDWTCEVGDDLHLAKQTVHTACCYIDTLLCDKDMPAKDQLKLLALTCLRISAKVEDAEEYLPSLESFGKYCTNLESVSHFKRLEGSLLHCLDWNLFVITPLHFLGVYLHQRVFFAGDQLQGHDMRREYYEYYQSYCTFFADLALQEESLQAYAPSLLAATILAVSRRVLHIRPHWHPTLTSMTNYAFSDVEHCYRHLWNHFMATFPNHGSNTSLSPTSVSSFPPQEEEALSY